MPPISIDAQSIGLRNSSLQQIGNVVLTGFMGTGKTTVGRLLAAHLAFAFVDTDAVIEQRFGAIADIFDSDGEAQFREYERQIALELAVADRSVIATGGRMMLDDVNAAALSSNGRVFCLASSPTEIMRRLGADATERPLLAGSDPLARIEMLLAERQSRYGWFEQVPTDGLTPDEIVADLAKRLGRQPR